MFVQNWYKMVVVGMTGEYCETAKSVNGTNRQLQQARLNMNSTTNNYPSLTRFIKGANGYGGVDFGDGTTPPALSDYKLSGNSFKTFDATVSSTTTAFENYVEIETIYTLTNTGEVDFTVSEIGLFFSHTSTNYAYNTLMERTLLDEPVTIPAKGIGVVTYKIRLNYPTD